MNITSDKEVKMKKSGSALERGRDQDYEMSCLFARSAKLMRAARAR